MDIHISLRADVAAKLLSLLNMQGSTDSDLEEITRQLQQPNAMPGRCATCGSCGSAQKDKARKKRRLGDNGDDGEGNGDADPAHWDPTCNRNGRAVKFNVSNQLNRAVTHGQRVNIATAFLSELLGDEHASLSNSRWFSWVLELKEMFTSSVWTEAETAFTVDSPRRTAELCAQSDGKMLLYGLVWMLNRINFARTLLKATEPDESPLKVLIYDPVSRKSVPQYRSIIDVYEQDCGGFKGIGVKAGTFYDYLAQGTKLAVLGAGGSLAVVILLAACPRQRAEFLKLNASVVKTMADNMRRPTPGK
ncbi:hypothetical protein C8R46DRAFT_1230592 [Mycena filopes]|nr:hypothetical protein C8R46DRAFT_1230592 [Mycena filopes]